MLLLREAGLVILEVPKTATQALRAALAGLAEPGFDGAARHVTAMAYHDRHAAAAALACGRVPETVAVVREPLSRLESWHRYLARDKLAGAPQSTEGVAFAAFIAALLAPGRSRYPQVGRQDRFTGWDGRAARVDHLFDHARLDLLVAFLAGRIGADVSLPARNVSPPRAAEPLTEALMAQLRAARAAEFQLYDAVAAAGHLQRVSSSAR